MDSKQALDKIHMASPIPSQGLKKDEGRELTELDKELAENDDKLDESQAQAAYAFFRLYCTISKIKFQPVFESDKLADTLSDLKSLDKLKMTPSTKGSSENSDFIKQIISIYKSSSNNKNVRKLDVQNINNLNAFFTGLANNKASYVHLSSINDFLSQKKSDELYGILQSINVEHAKDDSFNYPILNTFYYYMEDAYGDAIDYIREQPLPQEMASNVLSNQDINGFIKLMNKVFKTKIQLLKVPPQLKDPEVEKKQDQATNSSALQNIGKAFMKGGISGALTAAAGELMNKVVSKVSESESISDCAHLIENISIQDGFDFSTVETKEELVNMVKTDHEKSVEQQEKDFKENVLPSITSDYIKTALTTYSLQDDNNFLQNLFDIMSRAMYKASGDKGEGLFEWDEKLDGTFQELCPAFRDFIDMEESNRELDDEDEQEKEDWIENHQDYTDALQAFDDKEKSDRELTVDDFKDAETGELLTSQQLIDKGYNSEEYELSTDVYNNPDTELVDKIQNLYNQLPQSADEMNDEYTLHLKDVTDENGNVLSTGELNKKGYNLEEYTLGSEITNSDKYDEINLQWSNINPEPVQEDDPEKNSEENEENSNDTENDDNIDDTDNDNNSSTEEKNPDKNEKNDQEEKVQESIKSVADLMKSKLI